MFNKRNKKRGFTLIELIIVIAIIAILAAIAVPAFGKVREKAMDSANLGNARSIYSVVVSGIANGDIPVPESETTEDAAVLVNKKLLDVEPKPQGKGDDAKFTYTVDEDGNVQILIDEEVIYPKQEQVSN